MNKEHRNTFNKYAEHTHTYTVIATCYQTIHTLLLL